MQYDEIASMRTTSAAWKLLRADNAPLILSFLGRVFVDENVREIAASDLIRLLDDELYALNARLGTDTHPRSAKAYLDDWAAAETGWLRKYYVAGSDEPHYDATTAVERAVGWVTALRERGFVGTESRLNTVFELLRQIVFGTETDPEVRLVELRRRRSEIDDEIDAVERGDVRLLDATSRADRYQQFADTARALLGDFREVENNFRTLDREMREHIATWTGTKGELLDEMVGSRSTISDSDQGRSFRAFYDLLLSSDRLDELADLLQRVQTVDGVRDTDPRMSRIHHDWLAAGGRAQATVRQLSDQLRRFLDDQVWLENRRVIDLLRSVEKTAITLRDHRTDAFTHDIDASSPSIRLPVERPLYRKPESVSVDSAGIELGEAFGDTSALYDQVHVDPRPLIEEVQRLLRRTDQITLAEVVATTPLRQGLAELVTYLSLRDETFAKAFDDTATESVSWTDADGTQRNATVPRVIYMRTGIRV